MSISSLLLPRLETPKLRGKFKAFLRRPAGAAHSTAERGAARLELGLDRRRRMGERRV